MNVKIIKVITSPFVKPEPSVPFCKKVYEISKNSYDKMLALPARFGSPNYSYIDWDAKNVILKTALDRWYINGQTNGEVRQQIISAALVVIDILKKNGIYVQNVANTNPANEQAAADIILSAGYKHGKLSPEPQVIHPKPEYTITRGTKSIEVKITNAQGGRNTYIYLLMADGVTVDFGAGKALQFIATIEVPASPNQPMPQPSQTISLNSFMIIDTIHIGKFINLPSNFTGKLACIVLNTKGYSEMSVTVAVGIGF